MPKRTITDTVTGQKVPVRTQSSLLDQVVYGAPDGGPSLLDEVVYGRDMFMNQEPQAAGRFGVGESKHDWGIKYEDIDNLGDRRARAQTVGEQFGAFLNQAIIGEIIGGTIEGTGYLLDLSTYGKLLNGTEQEFGNWFSDIGKSMRTWAEEKTPVYTHSQQNKFAPSHWSWWMKNGKSVASTLSLMIPAAGAVRGVSMIGKALGFAGKIKPMASWIGRGLSQAVVSRHMENMMEASGVQEEMYDRGIKKGMSHDQATEYAARAASKTYALDWGMILQDIPQYLLLNKTFGKATSGLAQKSLKGAAAMGHKLTPIIKSKSAAIAWDMMTEGFEEGYQFIAAEEAKYLSDKIEDPTSTSSFDTRLNKYLKDGEFWTNVAMGALGAGVMQTAGKAINDLIQGGDPQVKLAKSFTSKVSHAVQQIQFADITGKESLKRAAITNLETALFEHGASVGRMDYVKEFIKKSGNPSSEDMVNLGIDATELETLQLNQNEILKHAEAYEKLWENNSRKYDGKKATNVTRQEFLIDTYNGYKREYKNRLLELEDKIINYDELSIEAKDALSISSEILSKRKAVAFQKKLLEDKANPQSPPQIKQRGKLIKDTETAITRLEKNLETTLSSRDADTVTADDALDIGGPYNLLKVKNEKDLTGHAILEYVKLQEVLEFADQTLKAAQDHLKEALKGKKEPTKPKPQEDDLNRIPVQDDYVLFKNKDGIEQSGIVDYIDETGDYVITPTEKLSESSKFATIPTGENVIISKDNVILDSKQYVEEDISDDSTSSDDVEDTSVKEDTSTSYLDISYMQRGEDKEVISRNIKLHDFLVNPKSSFEGITAEMFIDTTSEDGLKYFKKAGFKPIEIRKITDGNLTQNDIDEFFARVDIDQIPIGIELYKDGKVMFTGGLYYHQPFFRGMEVPAYIENQGADVKNKYIDNRRQDIKKNRSRILNSLLKGEEVYSDNLKRTNGRYNTSESRGTVLDRHGLSVNEVEIGVSRKRGKVHTSNGSTIPGLFSKTPGTPYVPTKKTINGKKIWAKVNPTKLTKEHADILWDAIITMYQKGNGRLSPFPDDRVENLTVREVIHMLALFGQLKTDIDHPDFRGEKSEHLRKKTLFVNSARMLTFGTTIVDIHEDNIVIAKANKAKFINWAMENKNYSISIGIKSMGFELNSEFKRSFKIGSWVNKPIDGNYLTPAQILATVPVDGDKKFALESDLQEYKDTGSAFINPNLLLGDSSADIKFRKKSVRKVITPKKVAQKKATEKNVRKLKKNNKLDSQHELQNLPVGAILYYIMPKVVDGVISETIKERINVGYVEYFKGENLGRVLNLEALKPTKAYDIWHWLSLDDERNFKGTKDQHSQADLLISYFKSRPHIDQMLIDLSNTAENKVQVEPIPTKKEIPKEDKESDKLEDVFDWETPMLIDEGNPIKTSIDLEKERKWFFKRFGNQKVTEVNKLIKLLSDGRLAYSTFTSDGIFIFKGAPEGALYHEAFHRVLLGYLSPEDRIRIYKIARKQFDKPNATESELSELLAEDFRLYRINGTKPKSRTIGEFFKDLLDFIITFFTGHSRITYFELNRLYDSIDRGKYRHADLLKINAEKLKGMQVPMSVDINRKTINSIGTYRELDKIVKFLTAILITTNEIDNLNDIKDIKMSKMFSKVESIIKRLENIIIQDNDTEDNIQISRNMLSILKIVISDEFSELFIDKIATNLNALNIRRVKNEDSELEGLIDNDYKQLYDRASYEINSKDNILASVKFLIATLPKDGKLDPNIGIPEFVDFNEMWNSIMYRLHDISSVEEMMNILRENSDQYSYASLIKKLEADKSGFKKQQLRAAVEKHRHNFINFLVKLGKKGIPTIEITNADVQSAATLSIKDWNLAFYTSKLLNISYERVIINKDEIEKVIKEYETLVRNVNREYKNTNAFKDSVKVINDFTELLNKVGIMVDELSVKELVKNRDENRDTALFEIINNDFDHIFNKIKNITEEDYTKVFFDEQNIRKLAEAYVNTHPEKISDIILGPSNNQYYVYSQNSHVSDMVRKFKKDSAYLEEHLKKIYNDNSYFGQQILEDDKVREGLEVLTFAMFGRSNDPGNNYLDINPIEDYLFKFVAMKNNLIPFPTMADRKTYYLLKGLKAFDFKYEIQEDKTVRTPQAAIDILLGYAKSERNRIIRAIKVRDEYNEAKELGDKARIEQLERNLVEGYHFANIDNKKVLEKGTAYEYHIFPSFNREGFNFELEARDEIKRNIRDNVKAELDYAENLGLIVGFPDIINKNKINYSNLLLDKDIIAQGTKDFGSENMSIKNALASYFVNTVIANAETQKLFLGDPAFFKLDKDTKRVIEDNVKRSIVLSSTGDNFAETVSEYDLNNSTFNISNINTQKFPSIYYNNLEKWHTDIHFNRLKKDDPTISDAVAIKKAKEITFDTLKAYRAMDPTDGQAWITPEMYRSLSIRLGEWSNDKDIAFNLLQEDRKLTIEEEKIVLDITFQPLKLVYFSLIHDGDLAIPTYHKASFATIFRQMSKGKYGNHQISEVLDRMERKGKYSNSTEKVDMLVMDSATKEGIKKKSNLFDDNVEQLADLNNLTVYKQPFSGLRRQLITDTHDVERTKTGTQFLKIALANLHLDDAVYTFNGEKVNGRNIRDKAFKALNNLSNRGRKELETRLGFKNGRVDKSKLINLLREDAKESNSSEDLIDALSMDFENIEDLFLELDSLTDRKWIQRRLISLISKYTIDVKLPGNQLIQFSNAGIRSINKEYNLEEKLEGKDKHIDWIKNATDDLNFMTLENGEVIPMGCIISINLFKHIIPNYDDISYAAKLKYLEQNPDLLGYRIPTQGQNSLFMLRVMAVYPETIGDTITLPSEFTALTGSDFDIDKAYVVRYNYYKSGGRLEKIKFIDGDTNDEEVLKTIYKSSYGKLLNTLKWLENKKDGYVFSASEMTNIMHYIDLTDSITLEELFIKMRTKGKYDLEAYQEIKDIVDNIPTEEEFIEKNKGKDIYEINSRKAVENRLIDSFFAVMKSETHFTSTSAPLGSLTDKLKKRAKKIRESIEKDRPNMYYLSPRFNERIKSTYNGGKAGIGPFALNNVHHVLAQLAELEMKGSFGEVMHRGTEGRNISLKEYRGKDGVEISNWLSALIDAHVDIAKDPYIMDLNVNAYTYNVTALLIRGGAGEITFDFLSQPILIELANETLLSNLNNTLQKRFKIPTGEEDADGDRVTKQVDANTYVMNKWRSVLTTQELKDLDKVPLTSIFDQLNDTDLTNTDMLDKDFVKRQLLVAKAFEELKQMGDKLNNLVQASQVDTKKFGTNITELRVFLNKIKIALNDNAFINLENILPYDEVTGKSILNENANFLGTYIVNGINFSLDVLGEFSIYGTPVFEEMFNQITKVTGNQYTTDPKFVNLLSDEIFATIVSKFFTDNKYVGMNSGHLQTLLNVTGKKLSNIRRNDNGIYDDLKENAIIQYLHLAAADNESLLKGTVPMFVMVPIKSIKDKLDKDVMINSFKELFSHKRKEVRDLARQLFFYSFFTSGFRSRIYGFNNIIPNDVYKSIEIKNPDNREQMIPISYNDMIKEILVETKNKENIFSYINMIDEVLINNHDNNNLIKLINSRNIDSYIETYKGKKYDRPIGVVLTNDHAKYTYLGHNVNGDPIHRPLIKIEDSQLGHIILRYIGTMNGKPVYVTQNMRSYSSKGFVVKEYNMDKSIIPEYNELMVIKPSMEEEFLSDINETSDDIYIYSTDRYVLTEQPDVILEGNVVEPNRIPSKNHAMSYDMPTDQNLEEVDTTTLALVEEGKRTATTRSFPLGEIGDIITFEGREQQYIIQEIEELTEDNVKDEEWIKDWSEKERWTPEHFKNVLGGKTVHIGSWQTTFAKVDSIKSKSKSKVLKLASTLSTTDQPLTIYVDGSDANKQSKDNIIGYGAQFSYNGKTYGLSGTKMDVDAILSQFKDMKVSNPTMEMLGLLEVLKRFKNTSEHLLIRQDYSGAVNYPGLWEHSMGSEQRADKPWTPKEPYIKYIVDEIQKTITELEANGGTLNIQWVPGHIDNARIAKYPNVFKGLDGNTSQGIVDNLTTGNNLADIYARMQESVDDITEFLSDYTPSTKEFRQLDLFDNIDNITDEQANERKEEC